MPANSGKGASSTRPMPATSNEIENPNEPPPSYEEAIASSASPTLHAISHGGPAPSIPARPLQPPRFHGSQHAQVPSPYTPWIYPNNYMCWKCHNTGIKLKNGLQCKDCWKEFAPGSPYLRTINTADVPNPTGRPLVLLPGDSRLGGIPCGVCRGTGTIDMIFFVDSCVLCGGVGRVKYLG